MPCLFCVRGSPFFWIHLRHRQRSGARRRRRPDRGREEGTAGRLVHDADRQSGDPAAEGGVREEISGHRAAISRAPTRARPPPRSLAEAQRRARAGRRVRRHLQHGPAQARRHRRAVTCRRPPANIPADTEGPGRLLDRDPALRVRARHQHHAGAEGRGAEDLSGPARSEVEGQDGLESGLDRGRARLRRQHPHEHGRRARHGLSQGAVGSSASSTSRPPRAPSSTR